MPTELEIVKTCDIQ